jgi:hypothetical protein
MSVDVLASTIEGTWGALMSARRLTQGPGRTSNAARAAGSSSLAFEAGTGWSRIADGYRAMLGTVGLEATVHICVCRRLDDAVQQILGRSSLLIQLARDRFGGDRVHVLSTGGGTMLLAFGMVVLGLVTFAAMLGFVILCDRV